MPKTKKQKKQTRHQRTSERANKRRYFIGGVVIAITGLIAIFVLASQPKSSIPADFTPLVQGAPSLAVLSDESVDHGDVVVNNFVETEFVVQNVGDETLYIFGDPQMVVVEGCCPAKVKVDDGVLSPGEITTISTRFTMHPGMDGYHDLRVRVASNDPEQPVKELTILSNWVS